jgi:2-hydroxychromene-2-carboxylate isomerase
MCAPLSLATMESSKESAVAKIEFWIEYASTYSWLSVARIGKMADAHGVEIDWQPFWLFPVREAQGLTAPFPEGSARAQYMWRDLERRARSLGVTYRRPEVYPFKSMPVARVGMVAREEGWCREFTEAAFRLHWTKGVLMGTPENLAGALAAAGQDAARVEKRASSEELKEALKEQTPRALQRGIFGAPSFVVGEELFWGDDRLEAAIEHARGQG